jgi:Alpha/beta hydrolase domain
MATALFANYNHNLLRDGAGKPVFDGYLPHANGMFMPPLDVPVIRVNTQSDFYFNPETRVAAGDAPLDRSRRYEVAGACHAPLLSTPGPGAAYPPVDIARYLAAAGSDICRGGFPKGFQPNDLPVAAVIEGSFQNLSDWVERGVPPPATPLIEIDALKVREPNPDDAKLDADGNALGGLRLPEMQLPLATYAIGPGIGCFATGYKQPFDASRCRERYGSKTAYLRRYDAAMDQLVLDRLIPAQSAARWKDYRATYTPDF